jgi:hypothetical protein
MKRTKLPTVLENLQVAFASRTLLIVKKGAVLGEGRALRALSSEYLEAEIRLKEKRRLK